MSLRRRSLALSLVLACVATAVGISPASGAGIAPPRASARWVQEAPDYASYSFADPWDFKAANDLPNVDNLNTVRFSNVRVEQGRWKGTAQPQGQLRLLQSWNSLPTGRDGEAHPIDADRFSHISFRMRLTGFDRSGAEVTWYDCGMTRPECKGGVGFVAEEGWHTYDLALVNDPAKGSVDWAGEIRGLILTPSGRGGNIEIDWIRLYDKVSDGVRYRSWDTHPDAQLIWDRDRNVGNNTATNPNWGVIATVGNGAARFNTDAMPPGRYFIYTNSPNGRSAIRRLVINGAPRPIVIKPNAVGGTSYDAAVRGNLWDFSAANDVALTRNMTFSIQNGRLIGTNAAPVRSDSGFRLPLNQDVPIDGDRFHRFTARVFYEGGFSLSGAPGGGMNARLVWRTTTGAVRVSEDIVVVPGWNTISLDLTDFTPNELLEGTGSSAWAGQQIELVRFDPHEDSGTRRFHVDWIKIAEDDRPTNNRFAITFRDRGYEPQSTARIYIDRNDDGQGGQLIGTVPVNQGKNTFNWAVPANLRGSGEWFVTVEITDRRNASHPGVSTGTIRL